MNYKETVNKNVTQTHPYIDGDGRGWEFPNRQSKEKSKGNGAMEKKGKKNSEVVA